MPFSGPGPFLGAQADTAYQVSRSLRFRKSATANLTRTFSTPTSGTTWTWSAWMKRGALDGADQFFFSRYQDASNVSYFRWNDTNILRFYDYSGGILRTNRETNAVFRDPSAWYHVVLTYDSNNGTPANRARIYVNNVEQTYSASSNPNSGQTSIINSSGSHQMGSYNSASYLDGYLAEVNFIDGQALTPSSFGAYDTNGVWQPKAYTGTYGTNGFYLPFSASATSSFAASFNGSTQTLATATNSNLALGTSDFTIECWIQPSAASSYTAVGFGNGATVYDAFPFYMSSGNLVTYLSSTGGSWDVSNAQVIATSIPTTTWSHVALTRSGSTFRAYFNGVQAYTFTSSASIYQSTNAITIAKGQGGFYFTGSISNLRFVKGTALYTSNFTPSAQPLTAVTNTQLLTLQSSTIVDNSANALSITNTGSVTTSAATPWSNYVAGQDSSGAGNNWRSNNINYTSSGTTYDSMIDSPTNYADGGNGRGNYCVLNPLNKAPSDVSLSNGNLEASSSFTSDHRCFASTFQVTTGKWYWEVQYATGTISIGSDIVGVFNLPIPDTSNNRRPADSVNKGIGIRQDGQSENNNATAAYFGSTIAVGDVIGVALDADAGTIKFNVNNGSFGSSLTFVSAGGVYTPGGDIRASSGTPKTIHNFGQRPFAYTPPSGFSALNTQNLPTPTIAAGNKYFDATTYTGDGAASGRNISLNFSPDLTWVKSRSLTTGYHFLFDGVRGATKVLGSSQTAAEYTNGDLGLGTNQFTIGDNGGLDEYNPNKNTATYVAWNWNAGGAPTTDNVAGAGNVPTAGSVKINGANSSATLAGSIAATRLSANTSAGFSVVTYTGTGANATVGHGLGVAPSMVIIKTRSASDWYVGHTSVGWSGTGYLILNNTGAAGQYGSLAVWQTTAPNSSVISLGTVSGVNANGGNYVAYCFAPVAGYSAFGSYTGNGSTDGAFIYTGFRPRWVMVKNITTGGPGYDWWLYDTSRNTYNAVNTLLFPNTSLGDTSGAYEIDVLSNGFKIRTVNGAINTNTNTMIYAAFAEHPFKISRAR